MESLSQTVLITAATTGVGYELSKLFAKNKFKLVIVGPEPSNLHNVSEVLKTLGAAKVTTICKDLATEKGADGVFAETMRQGIKIDILVNNTAPGQPGKFSQLTVEKDIEIIYQNIVSLVKLTKFYVKQMQENKSGKVLNLAPRSSSPSAALCSVYEASYAFIQSLTHSLFHELEGSGVSVTTLSSDAIHNEREISKKRMDKLWAATIDLEDPAALASLAFETVSPRTNLKSRSLSGPGSPKSPLHSAAGLKATEEAKRYRSA